MLFRVENLGPLREAEIDLSKRLIVLTGPNNSGKTYLAWSVYGTLQAKLAPQTLGCLDRLVQTIFEAPAHRFSPADIELCWNDVMSAFANSATADLDRFFAAPQGHFRQASISLAHSPRDNFTEQFFRQDGGIASSGTVNCGIGWQVIDGEEDAKVTWLDLRKVNFSQPRDVLYAQIDEARMEERRHAGWPPMPSELVDVLKLTLRTLFWAQMGGIVGRNCHLFPAERIAVAMFAKELALKRTALVDELLDAGETGSAVSSVVLKRSAGRYPVPIRDNLNVANDLSNIAKVTSPFSDLADKLELLLDGSIAVSDDGEAAFAPSADPSKRIGIHLTASVVKSLASLVFYFRHMAKAGDFVIIDEPELNLHPKNQRKVARLLARAVNRGFKIMVSTHSDHFVRELNNLIMLAADHDGALREKHGYEEEEVLSPDLIGAYLFDGTMAVQIPVDPAGIEVVAIDEEVRALNRSSRDIYFSLFEREEP